MLVPYHHLNVIVSSDSTLQRMIGLFCDNLNLKLIFLPLV